MKYAAEAVSLLLLVIIIVQDLQQRQISWVLLPLLFCSLFTSSYFDRGLKNSGSFLLFNGLFLGLQFVLLFFYFLLRKRKQVKIMDHYLGWGDLLFLFAITAAFSPVNFIFFYVLSLVISLLGFIVYRALRKNGDPTLPLAGTISICMMLALGLNYCTTFNSYDDKYILSLLTQLAL